MGREFRPAARASSTRYRGSLGPDIVSLFMAALRAAYSRGPLRVPAEAFARPNPDKRFSRGRVQMPFRAAGADGRIAPLGCRGWLRVFSAAVGPSWPAGGGSAGRRTQEREFQDRPWRGVKRGQPSGGRSETMPRVSAALNRKNSEKPSDRVSGRRGNSEKPVDKNRPAQGRPGMWQLKTTVVAASV